LSKSSGGVQSIWAKKGTHNVLGIFDFSGSTGIRGWFDLNTGEHRCEGGSKVAAGVQSTGNDTNNTNMIEYPNGWYRCMYYESGNMTYNYFRIVDFDSDSESSSSSNTIYLWGAQAEVNKTVATSFIPSLSATMPATNSTRAADTTIIKGTNFTDFYNQTEGTLFGEFTIKDETYSSAAIANINQEPGSSYANSIMFVEVGNAQGYFGRTYKSSSGINLSNSSSVLNSLHPSTTPQKVTFGYTTITGGELRAYWNGNNVTSSSDLSKVPTTLTNMRIGRGWDGSDVINAHIRKLSYYPKRLPDAQLQGLTQQ